MDMVDPVINAGSEDKNKKKEESIRIGVVGVTGSGKSTLINAVSGNNVLPSAIVPAEGSLVCCAYGEEYSATVSFKDPGKEDLVLKGGDFTLGELLEYSDERMNRGNHKGVKSIKIESPNFDLGNDAVLIDSPGLDSSALKARESTALQTLLPAIDICVCVTAIETSGDAGEKEFFDVVAAFGCPVVIIQNMLDSVTGSRDGDESKEEIASEYLERLKKTVERSGLKNRDDVLMVQMSAQRALKWKLNEYGIEKNDVTQDEYDESNYPEFIIKIKYLIKQKKKEAEGMENTQGIPEDMDERARDYFYADVDERVLFMLNLSRKLCLRQHREIMKCFIKSRRAEDHIPLLTGSNAEKMSRFVFLSGVTDLKTFSLQKHGETLINTPEHKCFFVMINGSGSDTDLNNAIKWHINKIAGSRDLILWVIQDFDEMLKLNGKNLNRKMRELMDFNSQNAKGTPSLIWLMHDNPVYNLSFLEYQQLGAVTLKDENDLLAELDQRFRELCDEKVLLNIGRMIRN